MIGRRDLLIGGACVAAAAGANAFRPHRNVSLLKAESLGKAVPETFGGWQSQDTGDPLAINGPGTLSAKIYSELVSRLYTNSAIGQQIMVLLAYGARQTDELQLHRPEFCYPAFGFTLLRNEPEQIPIASAVTVPARRLLAENDERQEAVIYWTRMGEFLPTTAGEQRKDRFRIAVDGVIPDGLLARFSVVSTDTATAWRDLERFIAGLLIAAAPANRPVLVGSDRTRALASLAAQPAA